MWEFRSKNFTFPLMTSEEQEKRESSFLKTYADKNGCHWDSALESRWCCRCQGGTEQGWCHMRSRRRVLCPGRFYRRSDILQREKRHKKNLWSQTPFQSSILRALNKNPTLRALTGLVYNPTMCSLLLLSHALSTLSLSHCLSLSLPLSLFLPRSLPLSQSSSLLSYCPKEKLMRHWKLLCPALTHFYKLLSLQSIQKGNREHSGPLAAGAGHSGTSGRCFQCCGDQLHSAGTEDGSLERAGGQRKGRDDMSTTSHHYTEGQMELQLPLLLHRQPE